MANMGRIGINFCGGHMSERKCVYNRGIVQQKYCISSATVCGADKTLSLFFLLYTLRWTFTHIAPQVI